MCVCVLFTWKWVEIIKEPLFFIFRCRWFYPPLNHSLNHSIEDSPFPCVLLLYIYVLAEFLLDAFRESSSDQLLTSLGNQWLR